MTRRRRRVLVALSRLHCMDGIASHLATLLPALKDLGWEAHVAVGLVDAPPHAAATLDQIQSTAATFCEKPALACHGRLGPALLVRHARILRRLVRDTQSDVIHLHGRGLAPAAWLLRQRGGPAIVHTVHLAPAAGRSLAARALRRSFGRTLGDRVIAISREMREDVCRQWGVPPSRVRDVPHGLRLEHFSPASAEDAAAARTALGVPAGPFICGQLARLGPVKRQDTVIRAVARLSAEGRKVVAVFAGHGEEADRDRIDHLAEQLNVADLIFRVGHCDPKLFLHACDVNVLASEREGFPLSIIEAMACGIVSIRTPVEGARDQIEDGVDGLLFPVGDDAALADHLRTVMDQPEQLVTMAARAQAKARTQFSEQAMASKTAAVYEELLS